MKEKKKSSFRGKVASNANKPAGGESSNRYLQFPKGISSFSLKENTRKVEMDLLPYIVSDAKHPDHNEIAVGDLWYRRPYKLHRNIGANNKSYVCPSSIGKKCPICEYQKELFDTDKKAAIALYPKTRVLYIPVPLNSKEHDTEPKYVWDIAESLFADTLKETLAEKEENEIFPDLEEGKTLECTVKWKTIGDSKPYPEVTHIDFFDRDPYEESILDEVPNLDEIINNSVLSYDELKNAFFELDEEEDKGSLKEDKDEDEKPSRSSRRQASEPEQKRRSKDEEPTSRKRKPEPEPDPEPEITWDELEAMSLRKLNKLVAELSLKGDYEGFDEDSLDEYREAIAEECNIDVPKKPASRRATVKEEKEPEKKSSRKEKEDAEEKPKSRKTAKEEPKEDPEEEGEEEQEEIPKKERCVACQGTGKNSRGRECPICEGTGRKPKEEEPEEESTPKSSRKKEAEKSSGKSGDKCPHGHKFGVDTEKFEECDDCKFWNDCADEKDKHKKK
jgi:hypothetical protein